MRSCTRGDAGKPAREREDAEAAEEYVGPGAARGRARARVCSQIVPGRARALGNTSTRPSSRAGRWTGRGETRTKLSRGRAASQA